MPLRPQMPMAPMRFATYVRQKAEVINGGAEVLGEELRGAHVAHALAGLGVALLPEGELVAHIAAGRLVRVLEDWCPKFAGYHLYYPSRRQPSPAFSLVVEALRLSA